MSVIINAEKLRKCYANEIAVNDISFQVHAGECCGILGPNGAGKTTALRMITGNILPSGGVLKVLGYAIPQQSRQMRAQIGIVPQQDNLDPDFTVQRNLSIYGSYFGLHKDLLAHRIPQLLEFASLNHKSKALIGNLSGGMQRRLSLARSLINQPKLLILDEPTTGLDPQARQLIWQRLRELKKDGLTLVMTSHYMEEAERLCDRLIIMDHGDILEDGTPQELIQRYIEPQVVEVYGVNADNWQQHAAVDTSTLAALRYEHVGDTWFCYAHDVKAVLASIEHYGGIRYLHRPANLEDVFLKLTGRDLRDG